MERRQEIVGKGRAAKGSPQLTPRELGCLHLLAEGNGAKSVAYRLGITTKTCQHYIASAKSKLGARNAVHAVAIAISLNLLDLDLG